MNLQDCIDIIRNCTALACEYHIKDNCQYGYEVRENRFECAKELAIKALEKQKPKKPVDTEEFTEGGWIGKCPCCGSDCNDVMNYCDQCGQKLDWREV